MNRRDELQNDFLWQFTIFNVHRIYQKKIKLLLGVLAFLLSLQTTAQKTMPDSNFHVYLLIGQSNMAGRGAVDLESKEVDRRILMLDSMKQWVPATDPVHFDKPAAAGVGPAISFAKNMLDGKENIRIGLIPCALGGSPIKVWEPDAVYLKVFHPYDDAVERARLAMQNGVLKGILWHQGESDNDSLHSALYLEKLKILINRLRTDLKQPDLPFVAGEIGYFNKTNYINRVTNQLPGHLRYTAVVSAKGLTDKGDKLHFDTRSARELGQRYANSMKTLLTAGINTKRKTDLQQSKNDPTQSPVVVLCFDDAEITHYNIVAPLLKKYDFGATFFICEMPWKSQSDSVYYMKWPQIAALYRMGFEIGNHTGHHKNLTRLSREEKQREIIYIEEKCKTYGIPKPISFAYPGNRDDSASQVVLKEMGYSFARTGGSKFFVPGQDPRLAIPSYTMGSSEKLRDRTMKALRELKAGQILAFTIHGVPDTAHPDYTTSSEVFTEFLQFMHDHHFKVISMRDLEKYVAD